MAGLYEKSSLHPVAHLLMSSAECLGLYDTNAKERASLASFDMGAAASFADSDMDGLNATYVVYLPADEDELSSA